MIKVQRCGVGKGFRFEFRGGGSAVCAVSSCMLCSRTDRKRM
jgi:hypothetical protein